MSEGTISIVIPCFNLGPMLVETLASVEAVRSDVVEEVIIVDDGSTDAETIAVLDGLDRTLYRVERTPNRRVSAARNTAIRLSSGEFILPVDSDNLVREPYFSAGREALMRDPTLGVAYGNVQFFGADAGARIIPPFDFGRLARRNYIDTCALIRRRAWEDVGGYDEQMPVMGYEDWDLWLRIGGRGWGFHHIDAIAFDYRVRPGSTIAEANRHQHELEEYIFRKPANHLAARLRDQSAELDRLRGLERSRSYRLGRALLSPARYVRDLIWRQ